MASPVKTNELLFDSATRHQVFLVRFAGSTARKITDLLGRADRQLASQLSERLARLGPLDRQRWGQGQFTTRRLISMRDQIRVQNAELHKQIGRSLTRELTQLAKIETDIASRRLDEAVGVELGNLTPSAQQLRSAVTTRPFQGRHLRAWVRNMEGRRRNAIESAIQLGFVTGETTPQIIRRLKNDLNVNSRQATAFARTATNHYANEARSMLYKENDDIIKGVRWVSTLDSRTSPICQALDGTVYPVDSGPRPPIHPNCRSTIVPVTKSWSELTKTPLKQGRGSKDFEKAFDRRLAQQGFKPAERRAIASETRASMDGQVSETVAYPEWLRRQSKGFQDQVLGPARGKLFRQGQLKLSNFVDLVSGRQFTLQELAEQGKAAGISKNIAFGANYLSTLLGVSRRTITRRLKSLGVEPNFGTEYDFGSKVRADAMLNRLRRQIKG